MTDTYTAGKFACTNCNWKGTIDIPKGTTKSEFLSDGKCPECDTANLRETIF